MRCSGRRPGAFAGTPDPERIDYPEATAFVAFLLCEHRNLFDNLMPRLDRSDDPGTAWDEATRDSPNLDADYEAWLTRLTAEHPFEQASGGWEEMRDGWIEGYSWADRGRVPYAELVQWANPARQSLRIKPTKARTDAGLTIYWDDDESWIVSFEHDGNVVVTTYRTGATTFTRVVAKKGRQLPEWVMTLKFDNARWSIALDGQEVASHAPVSSDISWGPAVLGRAEIKFE